MFSRRKYHVARLGNEFFCLTPSDLMPIVIKPISDEDLKKEINNSDAVNDSETKTTNVQASQTGEAFVSMKQAQSVKPEKTLINARQDQSVKPIETAKSNKVVSTIFPTGLGFFGFSVLFTFIYLVFIPALT